MGRSRGRSSNRDKRTKLFAAIAVGLVVIVLIIIIVAVSSMGSESKTTVTEAPWGMVKGREVKKFTLKNGNNQEVDVISYGAIITAIRTPDKSGKVEDVALGFDKVDDYVTNRNMYFGAWIGRVANRIRNAQFEMDGVVYNTSKNFDDYTLHGGTEGWSMKVWNASIEDDSVVMKLLSVDNDEGFPGNVVVTITFTLSDDGRFRMVIVARTDKKTAINMANHSYFNLAGHGSSNSTELFKHKISMNSDSYVITDEKNIATGEIRKVDGTVMDLRSTTTLGDVVEKVPPADVPGYDNNFCIPVNKDANQETLVAKVIHPPSGRTLEVTSNQPGVQFYTSNKLPTVQEGGLPGKDGQKYYKHGAFCLETQNYPNAVNVKHFPNTFVKPEEKYLHIVTYKFGVES